MASSSTLSSSSYSSPCAACKFLRRKCIPGCIFAPFFPPEEPEKFANVHKIFGASNVTKLLNDLLPHQREDAVNSLAYEAEARVRDPVYGCVGAISYLQRQVHRLQKELDAANADLIRFACNNNSSAVVAATQGLMAIETATVATSSGVPPPAAPPPIAVRPAGMMEYNRVGVHVPVPYSGSFGIPTSSGIVLWHDGSLESKSNMGDGGGNM